MALRDLFAMSTILITCGLIAARVGADGGRPLEPDPTFIAPKSVLRSPSHRQLWADPIGSPLSSEVLAKYPADWLPQGACHLIIDVVDSDGKPVVGAPLSVEPVDPPSGARGRVDRHLMGETDTSGHFELRGLSAGPVKVGAFAHSESRSPDAIALTELVEAHPAALTLRLPFALARLRTILGRVLDDRGSPVMDALIEDTRSGRRARTDAAGAFSLVLLPESSEISVRAAGCESVRATVGADAESSEELSIRVKYLLHGVGDVRVLVKDAAGNPSVGAHVWLRESHGYPIRKALADHTGLALLPLLPPRTRVDGGFIGATSADGKSRVEVYIANSAGFEGVCLVLPDPATRVSVRVVDGETGRPVRRALVLASLAGAAVVTKVRLASQGLDRPFERDLDSGRYVLSVESPEHRAWVGSLEVGGAAKPVTLTVSLVRRRERIEDVPLTIVVRSSVGELLSDGMIEILDPLGGETIARCARSSRPGEYELSGFSGAWILRVNMKDFGAFERSILVPNQNGARFLIELKR